MIDAGVVSVFVFGLSRRFAFEKKESVSVGFTVGATAIGVLEDVGENIDEPRDIGSDGAK